MPGYLHQLMSLSRDIGEQTWAPTMHMRVILVCGERILQQKHVGYNGEVMWKNVPEIVF